MTWAHLVSHIQTHKFWVALVVRKDSILCVSHMVWAHLRCAHVMRHVSWHVRDMSLSHVSWHVRDMSHDLSQRDMSHDMSTSDLTYKHTVSTSHIETHNISSMCDTECEHVRRAYICIYIYTYIYMYSCMWHHQHSNSNGKMTPFTYVTSV